MKMLIVSALVCAMMVLTGAAPPPEKTNCSSDWSLFGGRCYHYSPIEMTWTSAERNCQSLGGNLASVHNSQQYFDIQRLISQVTHKNDPAWIGGCDAQENGQWFWSDGTPFNDRHWCDGEPSNGGGKGQHCIQMNYSAKKCWDDLQCTRQLPSVCVRERC